MPKAPKRGMTHLNGHQLCAIDTETTGTVCGFHEVIQITILPLGVDLEPDPRFKTFDLIMRPEWPERVEEKALNKIGRERFNLALTSGVDRQAGADLLENYFGHLRLPQDKRISPLAQNWPFDREMLIDFLGYEMFNYYFDGRYRDLLPVANWLNDRMDFAGDAVPFPMHMDLSSLARRMGVQVEQSMLHDSLYDCRLLAETYKKTLLEPLT